MLLVPLSASSVVWATGCYRFQGVPLTPYVSISYLNSPLLAVYRLDASAWGSERAERPNSKLEFQRCAACTRRRTHAYLLPGHFVQETVELRLS